jgi:hypothetical protein
LFGVQGLGERTRDALFRLRCGVVHGALPLFGQRLGSLVQ